MDNYKVGKQIAMRRKECGYTQESLAEKLNVTSQAVSKWENGRALPETCILPDLAQALGTSIDSILVQNEIQILSAYYGDGIESYNVAGTQKNYYEVMDKIQHYKFFNWKGYLANQENFPSNPASDEKDYLTFVYMNKNGIHFVTCEEGESIAFTEEHDDFYRKADKGEYYIPNVPALPEFGKGNECSWAAALTAALQAMNVNTSYEEVMGVSGACYRLAFAAPDWDYSSVDGLVAYDYATPAYKAFGYKPAFENRVEKENRAKVRNKIINQVANNMPVLGINLRVAPEWGVICGYKEEGSVLFCRTKYDAEILESEAYKANKPNAYDYLYVDQWPFLITFFEDRTIVPTARENLLSSLRIFTDCNTQEQCRGYALGAKAYETWINGLRDKKWYETHNEEDMARRLNVNQFCILALYDARRAAYLYLKENVKFIQEVDTENLVQKFERISELAQEIHHALDFGEYVDATHVRKLWTEELREKQARYMEEMCELEQEALKLAETIIGTLA